jgi:hypothetical protein
MTPNSDIENRNSELPRPALGPQGGWVGLQDSEFIIQKSSMGDRGATP